MNTETGIQPGQDTDSQDTSRTCVLRILSTTDLHAHLLGFDYIKDCPAPGVGLAGLATHIKAARAEAAEMGAACILLDNGDILQGTPLGERLATEPFSPDHPIVRSFNYLRYDAIGIGNHDLDQGLDYLRTFASALDAQVVCSNLSGVDLGTIKPEAMIEASVPHAGCVRIGILSLLPLLTQIWNGPTLGAQARIEKLRHSLQRGAASLRQQGADLVLVLAHMGVGLTANTESAEAGALALAQVPGIDVLITGHTHQRFPARDFEGQPGVDVARGSLGSVPALMAGHAGSDLGVLDLRLKRDPAGSWHLRAHQSELRPNTPETAPDPVIERLAAPAHQATRIRLAQEVAQISSSIHSYFCLAMPGRLTRTVATAKAGAIARAVANTPFAALPLVASAAARGAGGRDGPDQFLHIPAGPVLRRHIAGLNPYANHIIGAVATGAELVSWAETAASIYAPHGASDFLLGSDMPPFHYDTLYGLTYDIDLTQPPGKRVGRPRYQGMDIGDDDEFLVATSEFRLAGGGGYPGLSQDRIVARSDLTLEGALIEVLAGRTAPQWAPEPPWCFRNLGGQRIFYDTGLGAHAYLDEIAHLSPDVVGPTETGFLRLALTL